MRLMNGNFCLFVWMSEGCSASMHAGVEGIGGGLYICLYRN